MNVVRSQILSIIKPYRRIASEFNKTTTDRYSHLGPPLRYTQEENNEADHFWSTFNRLTVGELKNILEEHDDDCELECASTEDYDGYHDGYRLNIIKLKKQSDEQYLNTLFRDIDLIKGQSERIKVKFNLDKNLLTKDRIILQQRCDLVINHCLEIMRELQLETNESISFNMESMLNNYIEIRFKT